MTLTGIDISHWQKITPAGYQFYIIKATEGVGYKDPSMAKHTSAALKAGAAIGFYHYARPDLGTSAEKEAAYFISVVKKYIGSAVLALDFEGKALNVIGAQDWCLKWLDYVYKQTGVRPLLYIQGSAAYIASAAYKQNYGIWAASTAIYYERRGINIAIQQNVYSNLDHDTFYGDLTAWSKYAAGSNYDAATGKKSNDVIADEVIAGKWGNGLTRRMKLTAAGYNYSAVQAIVNKKMRARK